MFSATLHTKEIEELAAKICVNPIWIDHKGRDVVPEYVHHTWTLVDPAVDRSWIDAPGIPNGNNYIILFINRWHACQGCPQLQRRMLHFVDQRNGVFGCQTA